MVVLEVYFMEIFMTTTRMETNQVKIAEDLAKIKQSYRNQVRKGRAPTPAANTLADTTNPIHENTNTMLTSPTAAASLNRVEKTFTHISSQGGSKTKFTDSHGASRAWQYSFERSHTQNQRTYEVISTQTQLNIEKTLLKPHLEKLKRVVDTLDTLAVSNEHYGPSAVRINGLYITLWARLEILEDTPGHTLNHEQVLAVLKACREDIELAKEDSVFSQHHSLARNLPVINSVCRFLDILSNFFEFLDKKMGKLASGDTVPVFQNNSEFSAGMFKPAKTHALAELDKLVADMQWYSKEIETTYHRVARLDCSAPGA